jgi:hypothetical protein
VKTMFKARPRRRILYLLEIPLRLLLAKARRLANSAIGKFRCFSEEIILRSRTPAFNRFCRVVLLRLNGARSTATSNLSKAYATACSDEIYVEARLLFLNPHLVEHSRGVCHNSRFQWHTIRCCDDLSGRFAKDFQGFRCSLRVVASIFRQIPFGTAGWPSSLPSFGGSSHADK